MFSNLIKRYRPFEVLLLISLIYFNTNAQETHLTTVSVTAAAEQLLPHHVITDDGDLESVIGEELNSLHPFDRLRLLSGTSVEELQKDNAHPSALGQRSTRLSNNGNRRQESRTRRQATGRYGGQPRPYNKWRNYKTDRSLVPANKGMWGHVGQNPLLRQRDEDDPDATTEPPKIINLMIPPPRTQAVNDGRPKQWLQNYAARKMYAGDTRAKIAKLKAQTIKARANAPVRTYGQRPLSQTRFGSMLQRSWQNMPGRNRMRNPPPVPETGAYQPPVPNPRPGPKPGNMAARRPPKFRNYGNKPSKFKSVFQSMFRGKRST